MVNKNENPVYTSENWSPPGADKHGHSALLSVRVPPDSAIELADIAASKQFPYRTVSAVLRHALARHRQWLQGPEQEGTPVTDIRAQIGAMNDYLTHEGNKKDFLQVIDSTLDLASFHLARGEPDIARGFVYELRGIIDKVPDSDRWKAYYLDKFESSLVGRLFPPVGE